MAIDDAGTNRNLIWDVNTLAWLKETQPSGGGGGGATIGSAVPSTATAVAVKDSGGLLAYPSLDASGNLLVSVTGAGSGGTSSADGAGYTAGTTAGTPLMAAVDDVGTTSAVENKVGIARMTLLRALHVNIRDASGNELGVSTAIKVDNSAVTQPIKLETELDYDTGGGTVATSIVGIALPASGGPVAGGTATNPLQVSLANTGANAAAVKVDGSTVTQPVSIAALPSGAVTNAGTFAVQAAQSGTWNVGITGQTAPSKFANLGSNNTLNVKSSAGVILSLYCHNANAADRYIQIHNTATVPVNTNVPVFTFRVPAGGDVLIGTDFFTAIGTALATGIAFAFSSTPNTLTLATAGDQSTLVEYI